MGGSMGTGNGSSVAILAQGSRLKGGLGRLGVGGVGGGGRWWTFPARRHAAAAGGAVDRPRPQR